MFYATSVRRAAHAALIRGGICALLAINVAYMLLLIPTRANAQDAPPPLISDSASNANGKFLRVYLATFEAGDQIDEKFGHDALWIVDTRARYDASYNWGIFDTSKPHFLVNFLRGRMRYSMYPGGPYAVANDTFRYRRENRTIWVQELNLTPSQKVQLRDFANWNNRDEHMFYMYDYFRDNCTTRIRDALDRVLHGQIRAALEPVASGVTYRWQARRILSVVPPAYAGIELAMGHDVDKPLNQWENSFLPEELMNHLRSVNVRDDSGHVAPLVIATTMEYQSTRKPVPVKAPDYHMLYTAIGLLIGALLFSLARMYVARGSNGARVAFHVIGALWSLVVGFFGVVAALLWFVTDHTITRNNENLLQANVLSLILAVMLLAGLARKGQLTAYRVALAIVVLSLIGFVMQTLPGLDQFNGEIIGLLLPTHIGIALGLRHMLYATPSPRRDKKAPSEAALAA